MSDAVFSLGRWGMKTRYSELSEVDINTALNLSLYGIDLVSAAFG